MSRAELKEVYIDQRNDRKGTPEDFVANFIACWADPARHKESFLDPMREDSLLAAPTGITKGREAGLASLGASFDAVKDLTAEVFDWAVSERRIFIQMVFRGEINGRPIAWHNVDVFYFDDEGRAYRRDAYFDPTELKKRFLRSPSTMVKLVKSRRKVRRMNRKISSDEREPF